MAAIISQMAANKRARQKRGKRLGPDHVQVFWKHKCFENISQLQTRPLIG